MRKVAIARLDELVPDRPVPDRRVSALAGRPPVRRHLAIPVAEDDSLAAEAGGRRPVDIVEALDPQADAIVKSSTVIHPIRLLFAFSSDALNSRKREFAELTDAGVR